jgi:predicted ATPase
MVDLVADIYGRGGLAIPTRLYARGSQMTTRMARAARRGKRAKPLTSLLLEAWRELCPSDAHSPDKVGGDRPSRTMTRLRLDEPTFDAVRNAVIFNPNARCKAESDLPAGYPRVLSAAFQGGFLDGVTLDFSQNLNCLIGGRGSGKSTALIALRAALGADLEGDDDPDEPDRMPATTTVVFVDRAGNRRTAVRHRGGEPQDQSTGAPIDLELADMGQGASGRLARGYTADPSSLRRFLDVFVDLEAHSRDEMRLLETLKQNGDAITSASRGMDELAPAQREVERLESKLEAAKNSEVEQLAAYAAQLASEEVLLERLDALVKELLEAGVHVVSADLGALALETGTNLAARPASDYVGGDHGIDVLLSQMVNRRSELRTQLIAQLVADGSQLQQRAAQWRAQHQQWQTKMEDLRRQLDDQGLKVQAGEIVRVTTQLNNAREKVRQLLERQETRTAAERERRKLLAALVSNRQAEHQRRKATLKTVVKHVNEQAEGLHIHVAVERDADDASWCTWLTKHLGFRMPRVARVARGVAPSAFADALWTGETALRALQADGGTMLDEEQVSGALKLRTYETIFSLQTMRLDDRVRIDVSEDGGQSRRSFDHLSAGQQRSVLHSLLLSADRAEPLIVDQPEDHLDASYIASSVVRQLEAAKERRQVIIATHSANLAVLGDAELVIPMYAAGGQGRPEDPGAVDRPATRERVCQLLEGGRSAYQRRGERYGFDVRPAVR